MKYMRIYTGPDGETHCEDLEMETTVREFTANVPPVTISQTFPGTGVFFVHTRVTPEFEDVKFHTAPRKMLVIQLKGVGEHEASDGTKRLLSPGDVVMVEDVTGKGHRSKYLGEEVLYAMIPLTQ
jgi:quercetin dioxygenase-like cupin family protein